MKFLKQLVLVIFFSVFSNTVQARNSFLESLNHRQEVKKTTRWTLADWFATKEKVRLMDMWLAANTSERLFEFYLEGGSASFEWSTLGVVEGRDETIDFYSVGAFISVFGLRANKKLFNYTNETVSSYSLQLRLLGDAEQSTNLTLEYGQRKIEDDSSLEKTENQFFGGHIRLYVFSAFGLYGNYEKYSKSNSTESATLEGGLVEYGIFFDLSMFQIFANNYVETRMYEESSEVNISGTQYGLRLYF